MAKVAVIGSFNMDITVFADRLPGPGETVLGNRTIQSPGGKGSNQAIAAARLGADVSFVSSVGNDSFGDSARALYLEEGIAIDAVRTSETSSGVAVIVVDEAGENQIAVSPGANRELDVAMVRAALPSIEAADVLIGQLETPLDGFMEAARIAKAAGATVILNPAPAEALPDELWSLVDIVTPNEHELVLLAGEGRPEDRARELLGRGATQVVVTRGALGVLWVSDDLTRELPARQATAVDMTGAGDAFNAGLAVGLAEGLSMADALRLGLRSGAFAVTQRGVIGGLGTRQQLDAAFPV